MRTLSIALVALTLVGCKTGGSSSTLKDTSNLIPVDDTQPTPTPSPTPVPIDPLDSSQHEYEGRSLFMVGSSTVNLTEAEISYTSVDSKHYFRISGFNDTSQPRCDVIYEFEITRDHLNNVDRIDNVTKHCDPCSNRIGVQGNPTQFYAVQCTGNWIIDNDVFRTQDHGGGVFSVFYGPDENSLIQYVFDRQ